MWALVFPSLSNVDKRSCIRDGLMYFGVPEEEQTVDLV